MQRFHLLTRYKLKYSMDGQINSGCKARLRNSVTEKCPFSVITYGLDEAFINFSSFVIFNHNVRKKCISISRQLLESKVGWTFGTAGAKSNQISTVDSFLTSLGKLIFEVIWKYTALKLRSLSESRYLAGSWHHVCNSLRGKATLERHPTKRRNLASFSSS